MKKLDIINEIINTSDLNVITTEPYIESKFGVNSEIIKKSCLLSNLSKKAGSKFSEKTLKNTPPSYNEQEVNELLEQNKILIKEDYKTYLKHKDFLEKIFEQFKDTKEIDITDINMFSLCIKELVGIKDRGNIDEKEFACVTKIFDDLHPEFSKKQKHKMQVTENIQQKIDYLNLDEVKDEVNIDNNSIANSNPVNDSTTFIDSAKADKCCCGYLDVFITGDGPD